MNMFVAILLAIIYLLIGNVLAYIVTENGSMWVVVLWPAITTIALLIFIVEFTSNFGKEIRKRVLRKGDNVGDTDSK